ncbi:MAG: hypothetical protein PHW31_02130 [Candidatus Pacebacteria bacterium]|nr:hypothetical protein [Candidatus Paceibacterota bacterium]
MVKVEKKILDFSVIDLHVHLRDKIPFHTKIAKESGIDTVVYMANCQPPLDNLKAIKLSLEQERYCQAIPVSAITKNLEGKELVNVDRIKPFVIGFSDDGKYLEDLVLLKEILRKDVLVLAHCSPAFEIGVKNPELETENIEKYLEVFSRVRKSKLHFQHISQKTTVDLIRDAKKSGLSFTCETCPHYFSFSKHDLDVKVNPPLATIEDILAIKKGLADGTIDVIASDYAPEPRITGIGGFRVFLPLCYGLVLDSTLTLRQLEEKISLNPKKIIS